MKLTYVLAGYSVLIGALAIITIVGMQRTTDLVNLNQQFSSWKKEAIEQKVSMFDARTGVQRWKTEQEIRETFCPAFPENTPKKSILDIVDPLPLPELNPLPPDIFPPNDKEISPNAKSQSKTQVRQAKN